MTRYRLWANSAGYCQRPECQNELFHLGTTQPVTVAEIAHIISASPDGPRSDRDASETDRRNFDNLILLCPNCHTIIDKAEDDFSAQTVRAWKADHGEKVKSSVGIPRYDSREKTRQAIEVVLAENRVIWERYGPHGDNTLDPESSTAAAWEREAVKTIVPNNRLIVATLDVNRDLLNPDEIDTLARMRVHADGFALRHLSDEPVPDVATFPSEMDMILR